MNGLLLIDKPSGPTSFDVVRAVRRAAQKRKVGHTGTLDPLASGLLVVCIGEATKLVPFLMEGTKRYLAQVALGAETDSDDALGEVVDEMPIPKLTRTDLEAALTGFIGRIDQKPPKLSALKQNGEPLHRRVRRGEQVDPKIRQVEVQGIEITDLSETNFSLDVRCGKGTYIRALARDIARALNTRGHLAELRRIETSGFNIDEALRLDELETIANVGGLSERCLTLADALPRWPRITLSADEESRIRNGQAISLADCEESLGSQENAHLSLLSQDGKLVAVARLDGDRVQPVRVMKV